MIAASIQSGREVNRGPRNRSTSIRSRAEVREVSIVLNRGQVGQYSPKQRSGRSI